MVLIDLSGITVLSRAAYTAKATEQSSGSQNHGHRRKIHEVEDETEIADRCVEFYKNVYLPRILFASSLPQD